LLRAAAQPSRLAVIHFGSTSPAMNEALDALAAAGIHVDALRLRAFPFPESVRQFVEDHDRVFVVEQNRDAQMRSLLVNELGIAPARLTPVLHYDGTPITARFITAAITQQVYELAIKPRKNKGGKGKSDKKDRASAT
ncbi:MAG TPA: 2-oxoacid:acceptor oxidoreductase subunit alpha, partial [Burkholderiaceae bacterium]|nr:2-oxoacid:acceptor oxidoreductase subunit alpha [Burkholderiaceae bacterium]